MTEPEASNAGVRRQQETICARAINPRVPKSRGPFNMATRVRSRWARIRPVVNAHKEPLDMTEFQEIMATIEKGIDVARQNPRDGEPIPADDYMAWCICEHSWQAGFRIVRRPTGFSYSQPDTWGLARV